jgi:hypothetical protein
MGLDRVDELEQAGVSTAPLFRSISRHGQVQLGRLSGIDVARVVKKLADRGWTLLSMRGTAYVRDTPQARP